jgi:hypothetical protein
VDYVPTPIFSVATFVVIIIIITIIIIIIIINHCPSARCAYAANAVVKDLDIFAIGAVSLDHILNLLPKIVNTM